MKKDLFRLSVLCFVAAIVCLVFLITGETGTLPFLTLIAVQTVGAMIIVSLGNSKHSHKEVRRAIMGEHPSLMWRVLGLSLGLPLIFGFISFYGFKSGFDVALVVFLGTSYLCQVAINLMLMPYIQKYLLTTFD